MRAIEALGCLQHVSLDPADAEETQVKAMLVLPHRTRLALPSATSCTAAGQLSRSLSVVGRLLQALVTAHSERPQRALADKRANVASLAQGANLNR